MCRPCGAAATCSRGFILSPRTVAAEIGSKTVPTVKPKLSYFNFAGRGMLSRLICAAGDMCARE